MTQPEAHVPLRRWIWLGLLLWVAACYVPALPGPYQFDDHVTVAVDPGAASLSAWWQADSSHVRPLLKGSFALTHGFGEWLGNVPLGHRLGNLAIHLATIALLLRLGLQLAGTCLPRMAPREAAVGAALAAALFGLHPLATEAVSYISGRSMALGTLLACACLAAWIHARTRRSLGWATVSVLLFASAALSRETVAFSIPLLVLAWELLRTSSAVDGRGRLQTAALAALLFIALACATMVWMLWHDRYPWLLHMSLWIASLRSGDASLLTAFGYLGSASLLLRYPSIDPYVEAAALSPALRLAASTAIVAALGLAWRLRSTQPHWLLAFVWVLAWLLPLYAVPLRHDAVSERHFYPALWGLAFALTNALALATRGTGAKPQLVWILSILGLISVSAVTIVRNTDYRSEIALWESASHSAPNKLRVQNNLGVAYMEAGRWDEACAAFARAIEAYPNDATLRWNLAAARGRDLRVLRGPVLMRWPTPARIAPARTGCPTSSPGPASSWELQDGP